MKIYTQTGDQGKTSLLSGERVLKSHARVRAYGDVDELNAVVGMLVAALGPDDDALRAELARVQSDLFHAGAWLATGPESEIKAQLVPLTGDDAARLEARIDAMTAALPELKAFILPGGHITAAWGHMARTVCRRAERSVIELAGGPDAPAASEQSEELEPVIVYLNRLSDYFFVLSRHLNHRAGVTDVLWQGG